MKTHGDGLPPWNFRHIGRDTVIENAVLIFHPDHISIGENVYIGHQTILKGYYNNEMIIGDGCWIGQQCFFHSAGNIEIGQNVGVGPGVKIITSVHDISLKSGQSIIQLPLNFKPVYIGDGSDIGVNAVILPGVQIGRRVQVGAGAVVTESFPDDSIIAGVPAKLISVT